MIRSYIVLLLISTLLLSSISGSDLIIDQNSNSNDTSGSGSKNNNSSDTSSSSSGNETGSCLVYVDINSNYTLNNCGKKLSEACFTIYQALQICGTNSFNPSVDTIGFDVTVMINDGVYSGPKNMDMFIGLQNNTVVIQAINQGAVTIDMQGSDQRFVSINQYDDSTSYVNFTIQGIRIINANYQSNGYSVIFSDRKTATAIININQCTFENIQGINGTALYSYSSFKGNSIYQQSQISITNSIFNNNVAELGASIYFDSLESLLISNCTFNNNNATNVGVVYQSSSTINVVDSKFTNCYTEAGGIIYYYNGALLAIITNTVFDSNFGGGLRTGCLYIVGGIIENSVFSNNYNLSGILFYNNYISTENTVSGCLFINNTNGFYHGGGIFIKRSIIHLNNTVFQNNTAINGGAIYFSPTSNNNTSTFNNVTFVSNIAENMGGGFLANNTYVTLEQTTMTNNQALMGSNIFCQSSTIDIFTTSFSVNSLQSDTNDKGISCGVGTTCTFSGDKSYYGEYCSSNWTPVKPGRILTSGQIAGIIIGCLAGVFIICTVIVIIIKKVSRKGYHHI